LFRMLAHSALSALAGREAVFLSARAVSSKYPKPKPRHYRRRLFEAAVAPVMPKTIKQCTPPLQIHQNNVAYDKSYSDYEVALADLVRDYLKNEEFRVMAVCQFTSVPGRTLHFAKNQLRLKDIEFRNYGNKIMKKVFEGSPLSSLSPVFVGSNAILLGKTPESLVTISKECNKLNWIVPMVYVLDSRIVSSTEVEKLAALPALNCLYGETVQILNQQIGALPQSLDSIPHSLINSLSHLSVKEETTGDQ
ncbi:hypothetical protein PFISCL1PPCAC_5562, partial [Pristionchus fissidentatus]